MTTDWPTIERRARRYNFRRAALRWLGRGLLVASIGLIIVLAVLLAGVTTVI